MDVSFEASQNTPTSNELFQAISRRDLSQAMRLLSKAPELAHARLCDGQTVLHVVCKSPELLEFLSLLLSVPGVNVNYTDRQDHPLTPMMTAIMYQNESAFDMLLEHHPDWLQDGVGPFHTAIRVITVNPQLSNKCVRALMAHVPMDRVCQALAALDSSGNNAYDLLSLYRGDFELTDALLNLERAALQVKQRSDATCHQMAYAKRDDKDEVIVSAARRGSSEVVRRLLQDLPLTKQSRKLNNAGVKSLHVAVDAAVSGGHLDIVRNIRDFSVPLLPARYPAVSVMVNN